MGTENSTNKLVLADMIGWCRDELTLMACDINDFQSGRKVLIDKSADHMEDLTQPRLLQLRERAFKLAHLLLTYDEKTAFRS